MDTKQHDIIDLKTLRRELGIPQPPPEPKLPWPFRHLWQLRSFLYGFGTTFCVVVFFGTAQYLVPAYEHLFSALGLR